VEKRTSSEKQSRRLYIRRKISWNGRCVEN
jgi:hypothetical protein